ncbi:MAG: hypothetical protein ACHQPI_03465 [Thermoanaerobaculia bacterium]
MEIRSSFPDRDNRGLLDRRLPGLLLLAGLVGTIPFVRSLYVPDLNWCYPYLASDAYDWINNGLYWAGLPVLPSFRPPGLPLVITLLYRLELLSWLPILNVLVLGATALLLFCLLRARFSPAVSALTAWVFYSNGFVQDFVRWIFAEIWAIPFLILAAILFRRAEARPLSYVGFGLAVGISFLFHYAALPAGIGFAVAIILTRRQDLKRRQLWIGAALAAIPPAIWLAVRWRYARLHPGAPAHGVEALLRFVPENVPFFLFAGLALLGIGVLPLYAAGVLSCLGRSKDEERLLRGLFVPVLAMLGLFFGFFYDWTDKRFLLYLFPFVLGFFALGVERLLAWGRKSRGPRIVAAGYLLFALAWNQIAYPPYGIGFLALTPRDFLEASSENNVKGKTTLFLVGARVLRVHVRIRDAFRGGLFDFSLLPSGCSLEGPAYSRLPELKWRLDALLVPGAPVGMERLPGWPPDNWGSLNRMSNILGRPVILPSLAPCRIAPGPVAGLREAFAVGPYSVDCRE